MKQITRKLKLEFAQKFIPIGEMLRDEGHSDYEIGKAFLDYLKSETKKFYKQKKQPQKVGDIIEGHLYNIGPAKADSKIETIYYDILTANNIPFEFQYKIGPYRADFLIDKVLVFEIDGPMHDKEHDDKRDEYINRMGYEVLRVPAWLASVNHDAIVAEIKELIK